VYQKHSCRKPQTMAERAIFQPRCSSAEAAGVSPLGPVGALNTQDLGGDGKEARGTGGKTRRIARTRRVTVEYDCSRRREKWGHMQVSDFLSYCVRSSS